MQARLSGVDTFQLSTETHQHYNHTFKVAILDPSSDPEGWCYDRYREIFKQRIHCIPALRWRVLRTPLGLNFPIWVEDPEFNIDYHLRRVVCPPPGDQKSLCEFMSSIYTYQLDRSRPLWLNWVVEGLEGGKVATVTLVHHAYADGIGASHALHALYSMEAGWVPEPAPAWQPDPLPSWIVRLGWGIRDLPAALKGIPKALLGVSAKRKLDREWQAQGGAAHPATSDAPPTPLSKPLSAGRSFVCDSLRLADIKTISKGFGLTINDVFLSCVAAALRRYLMSLDHPVDKGPLVAGVPFGLARPPGKEMLGNYSTTDMTWLHTEIEDPVERLQASGKSAREMKAHLSAVMAAGADIGAVAHALPPVALTLMGMSARRQVEKSGSGGLFGNVVVSNVPGPRESLYLKDYTMDNWFSIGQLFDGANLNFTLWSYRDSANLCILADSRVVPDAWVLFNFFKDEVKTLLALAAEHRVTTVEPGVR